MADALKDLTEAVLSNKEIKDANRDESIELLSYIAEESKKPPEYRKKTVVWNAIEKLGSLVSLVEGVRRVWDSYCPVIKHFFS